MGQGAAGDARLTGKRQDETDKVISSDGWLKTGDIAVMQDDGFVKLVDRKKDMILVSGFNVYPNQIEEEVAKHPEVLEVAAVGVPDEKSGEAVKLFVVKRSASLTEKEVISFCGKSLTRYRSYRSMLSSATNSRKPTSARCFAANCVTLRQLADCVL